MEKVVRHYTVRIHIGALVQIVVGTQNAHIGADVNNGSASGFAHPVAEGSGDQKQSGGIDGHAALPALGGIRVSFHGTGNGIVDQNIYFSFFFVDLIP